jgi:hypothetical protein
MRSCWCSTSRDRGARRFRLPAHPCRPSAKRHAQRLRHPGDDRCSAASMPVGSPLHPAQSSGELCAIWASDTVSAKTEREGFEPSNEVSPVTRFPVAPVQPLRHLSGRVIADLRSTAVMERLRHRRGWRLLGSPNGPGSQPSVRQDGRPDRDIRRDRSDRQRDHRLHRCPDSWRASSEPGIHRLAPPAWVLRALRPKACCARRAPRLDRAGVFSPT